MTTTQWSVFAKPWADRTAPQLAGVVRSMGFDAVELPVRAGCAVTPERVGDDLLPYGRRLADQGVRIASVAVDNTAEALTDEVFLACQRSGVPLVRIMPTVRGPYRDEVVRWQEILVEAAPRAERYGIRIGLQPHCGAFVHTALAMREVLDAVSETVGLIWDAGHEGLAGEDLRLSLDAVWDRLCMVNLKNAVRSPVEVSDEFGSRTGFAHVWVDGPDGYADWAVVLDHLVRRGWRGPITMAAEYSGDEPAVDQRAAADLRWAQQLWATSVERVDR
ncbi:MAG TPA: sugar phosphate isomerase/epimerase [Candidatus Avipropionibacterium avicola]|uniref:Sugar phosphate isomerase/epimerase n=1 Tax=Candidatus Avipropionibacterium avicola TaxID=2840701 RepID=A0A9D1H1U8_9ACTN|nr:sugar phosphate isomerase/epimerase [Candidatus Avipropionibacterium avicola]